MERQNKELFSAAAYDGVARVFKDGCVAVLVLPTKKKKKKKKKN
jgi:hypothetical protein